MLLEIKMPPFLFGGCVLVGQIYFVYVKGFVGLYDCRTGGHIPFNVKSVFLVEVGKVFVVRVLRYIVLIAEKGAHAAQLQNTFSSVHNCDFVLCHQLFATMSSDELKKQHRTNSEICSMLLYITKYYNLTPISELLFGFEIVCHIAAFS